MEAEQLSDAVKSLLQKLIGMAASASVSEPAAEVMKEDVPGVNPADEASRMYRAAIGDARFNAIVADAVKMERSIVRRNARESIEAAGGRMNPYVEKKIDKLPVQTARAYADGVADGLKLGKASVPAVVATQHVQRATQEPLAAPAKDPSRYLRAGEETSKVHPELLQLRATLADTFGDAAVQAASKQRVN